MPQPDLLDFTLPPGHICLITDDGSQTTVRLAECLAKLGWKPAILSFPQANPVTGLDDDIPHCILTDWGEEHLQQQLTTLAAQYGPISTIVHLHPRVRESIDHLEFSDVETAIVRHVFLLAKHLKASLCNAAEQGRSCFMTVARLDGAFGIGRSHSFSPIGGGLFGLTKSLNYEWESVFCRAIDLSPDLKIEESVRCILDELYDPNRCLVEVGYGSQGRTTLVCNATTCEETCEES